MQNDVIEGFNFLRTKFNIYF